MNKLVTICLLIVLCTSLKVNHNQLTVPGGWSPAQSDPNIDQYIRQQFPYLSSATLTSAQTQVVTGTNYLYTYQYGNSVWAIIVNDQPWANYRQVISVQKTTQSTDAYGNILQTVLSTQLDPRDFTAVARSKFSQWLNQYMINVKW
jgi:hypothetical protein